MLNTFIASLIALFFWGKISRKTQEKINKASWIRTGVYFVLMLMVGAFFYKSYQVATVYNSVQVNGIKSSVDKSGIVTDTVRHLIIQNNLSSKITYKNEIQEFAVNNFTNEDGNLQCSGMNVLIAADIKPDSSIIGGNKTIQYLEEIEQTVGNFTNLYEVEFCATQIPSLIPFYPEGKLHTPMEKDTYVFKRGTISNLTDNYDISLRSTFSYSNNDNEKRFRPKAFETGMCFVTEIGTYNVESIDQKQIGLDGFAYADNINTMNFFTAADISQYTYALSIKSSIPVDLICVQYDLPIELCQQNDLIDVGPNGFIVSVEKYDSLTKTKEGLKNFVMMAHVKLPTLANLQLVRSLILTTLITALVSLFISNLFFAFRKSLMWLKKKYDIKILSKFQLNAFRRKAYMLLFVIACLSMLYTWMIFNDSTILISHLILDYIFCIPILIIVIAMALLCFFYRQAQKNIVKNQSNKGETSNLPSIFFYEKTEEEEMGEVFKNHKESLKEMEQCDGINELDKTIDKGDDRC